MTITSLNSFYSSKPQSFILFQGVFILFHFIPRCLDILYLLFYFSLLFLIFYFILIYYFLFYFILEDTFLLESAINCVTACRSVEKFTMDSKIEASSLQQSVETFLTYPYLSFSFPPIY